MTPDQYSFSGDAITFLGLIGVASTLLIVVTAFKRFYNSPYNLRMKTTNVNESPEVYVDEND
jgi:hypothetical protein